MQYTVCIGSFFFHIYIFMMQFRWHSHKSFSVETSQPFLCFSLFPTKSKKIDNKLKHLYVFYHSLIKTTIDILKCVHLTLLSIDFYCIVYVWYIWSYMFVEHYICFWPYLFLFFSPASRWKCEDVNKWKIWLEKCDWSDKQKSCC